MRANRRNFGARPPALRRASRVRALLAAVTVIAVLAAAIACFLIYRPFTVRKVVVHGSTLTGQARARELLQHALTGRTLLTVNARSLHRALASLPAVSSITVERRWPHTLVVRIAESQPVALAQAAGERWLLDLQGTVIGPAPLADSYPILSCPSLTERSLRPGLSLRDERLLQALKVAGRARALHLWPLQRIDVDQYGGITCVSQEGVEIRCGAPTRLDTKLRLAATVLASRREEPPAVVDVADPANPFLRKRAAAP